MDVLMFECLDVVDGSVGRVSRHLARPQSPAEARAPDQVEHRLVFHDFRRRDQYIHDNPRFTPTNHIMGVLTWMSSLSFDRHDSRIRVGGTDHEVSHAPIGAPYDLPIRFAPLLDPVVTRFIALSEFLIRSR